MAAAPRNLEARRAPIMPELIDWVQNPTHVRVREIAKMVKKPESKVISPTITTLAESKKRKIKLANVLAKSWSSKIPSVIVVQDKRPVEGANPEEKFNLLKLPIVDPKKAPQYVHAKPIRLSAAVKQAIRSGFSPLYIQRKAWADLKASENPDDFAYAVNNAGTHSADKGKIYVVG